MLLVIKAFLSVSENFYEKSKAAATASALSTAEGSYPTSGVRGSGQEYQAVTVQEWPTGATLRPRPGAVAGKINPRPRSGGCAGTEGPRGAIPR